GVDEPFQDRRRRQALQLLERPVAVRLVEGLHRPGLRDERHLAPEAEEELPVDAAGVLARQVDDHGGHVVGVELLDLGDAAVLALDALLPPRSEEHTSELQSLAYLVWRLLLEKKKLGLARGCGSGLLLARGPVAGEV